VTEETTHAQDDINAWSAEFGKWYHLQVLDAAVVLFPYRTDAVQCEHLPYVVAMRAHGGGAAHAYTEAVGIAPGFALEAVENFVGKFLADAESRLGRKSERVETVEISAGRKYVRRASTRSTAGTRRNVTAVEGVQQVIYFFSAAEQIWNHLGTGVIEHLVERFVSRGGGGVLGENRVYRRGNLCA